MFAIKEAASFFTSGLDVAAGTAWTEVGIVYVAGKGVSGFSWKFLVKTSLKVIFQLQKTDPGGLWMEGIPTTVFWGGCKWQKPPEGCFPMAYIFFALWGKCGTINITILIIIVKVRVWTDHHWTELTRLAQLLADNHCHWLICMR